MGTAKLEHLKREDLYKVVGACLNIPTSVVVANFS